MSCCPRTPWSRDQGPPERMPDPIYPLTQTPHGFTVHCQICGEPGDGEMGEFGLPEGQTDPHDGSPTIVAHGQCGLDHGLGIA